MKPVPLCVAAFVLCTYPSMAEDRFAPNNPWFQDFEQACRDGMTMNTECQGSVIGAFAAREDATPGEVTCDFAAFWSAKDAKYANRTSAVLPWQYVVEALVAEPGVCQLNRSAGEQ